MTMNSTILIVDDDPLNLKVLEEILVADGHKIHVAVSGEIALKAIADLHPDLILLDIIKPGMNGLEVCRRLKATPTTAVIPILFISTPAETKENSGSRPEGWII
jgi:CheY-like chemotaxis protein